MNISENKRVVAISALFLAAFGAIVYHGYSRSCDFNKAQAELTEIQDAFEGYSSSDFAPTAENLKQLREAYEKVNAVSRDMQAEMEKFAVVCYGDGKVVKPGDFQNEVRSAIARVAALAVNTGAQIGNPAADLGMAQYKNALALEKDIPCRSFQLKAVEQVANAVLESGAPLLDKVYCAPLPEDDARDAAAFPLDFEVAFNVKRGQLPGILNKIVSDRKYFLTITGISVVNNNPLPGIDAYTPPSGENAAPATGDDLSGGEAPAAEAPVDSKPIATRKTGDSGETVRVHLIMQVRFFNPAKAKS